MGAGCRACWGRPRWWRHGAPAGQTCGCPECTAITRQKLRCSMNQLSPIRRLLLSSFATLIVLVGVPGPAAPGALAQRSAQGTTTLTIWWEYGGNPWNDIFIKAVDTAYMKIKPNIR